MSRRLQQLCQFLALAAVLHIIQAAEGQDFQAEWQKTRERQPLGLQLELKLPKTEFHQGEIIPATLIFRNSSTNQYHLWTGHYDRSGRIPDIVFRAERQNHGIVADPLGWYFTSYGGFGGGLGGEQNLGEWSITLPVNQWLRLDTPGIYRIYAWSNRPQPGATDINHPARTRTDVVSDVATVKITPLEAKQEQEVLAEVQAAMIKGGESNQRAIATLRYLQTPAARKMLLPLLSHENSFDAMMGLVAAPDPVAESRAVLEAAQRPDVAVSGNMIWLYTILRSFGQKLSDEPKQRWKELEEANKTYQRDFVAEVRAAVIAKQGEVRLSSVLTLLIDSPQDHELRAALIDHKEQLTKRQVEQLVQCWRTLAGDDLLPVLRMAAGPPLLNAAALGLLAEVSPADARPLIIEDLRREQPQYINPAEGRYALQPLEALPDRELPELDETLRTKLLAKDSDLDTVMPLIARYATTNLLADVLLVYRRAEGRWACDFQNAALRYWIRCQPKEGTDALARALEARVMTGCFRSTLSEVLMENWTDVALPVVIEALQDDDPEVIESAVTVLERHAGPEVIPQVISAIGRLAAARHDGIDQMWRAKSLASILTKGKRWRLTAEQQQELTDALRVKPTGSGLSTPVSASKTAERIRSRWAAPPTNWTPQVSSKLRPYEACSIKIAGADLDSVNKVSPLTKIDGKEIGSEAGHLDVQGYGGSLGIHGIHLVNSYLPVFRFPTSQGEHSVNLVLSTAMKDYHFQPCAVRVEASEEERKLVAEFEASGASRFLNDSHGFTPRQSTSPALARKQEMIPYTEVLRFVERHPKSYLTTLITERINLIWLWDINEKGVATEDRRSMGKILGAIDKARYLAEFRVRVREKSYAEVLQYWLDGIESY